MSLPEGYNADGVVPHIIIYDNNWQKQFEYVHEYIDPNGTRDFYLKSWKISGGINSDAGQCDIGIDDSDHELTLKIRPNWIIQIYLHGTQSQLWFTGFIREPAISREGYGQQDVIVKAYGYANTLTQRFINITKAAYEAADGIESNTDGITISELAKFCLHDDAMIIPPADPNLTLDVEDLDIILNSFTKENQSQAVVLAELANIAGALYGVTPNLEFYFRSEETQSRFIVANDSLEDYDPDNLYIIRNRNYMLRENTTKRAVTNLIGLDITIQVPLIPDNGGTDRANTSYDYIGFSLNAYGDGELKDIQVFLQDREPGDGDLNWKVTNTDWNGNEIASGTITEATLNALGAEGNWVTLGTVPISEDDNGNTRPRILWLDNSHSSYYILIKEGVDSYTLSISGSPDQNPTGQLRLRSTEEKQVILKAQNTTQKEISRDIESMEYLSEKPSSETATTLFEGILNQSAKVRQIYAPLTVSVNQNPPPLGKRVRFIDSWNGLDTNPLCIGYDIYADHQTALSAIDMNLELEELA